MYQYKSFPILVNKIWIRLDSNITNNTVKYNNPIGSNINLKLYKNKAFYYKLSNSFAYVSNEKTQK